MLSDRDRDIFLAMLDGPAAPNKAVKGGCGAIQENVKMTASFHIEPLSRRHDTSRFDCEKESLNEFIKRFARQNEEKRISRTFVAVAPDRPEILGYYTLSTGAIEFADLPEESRRRLPRYPIPVAHLGCLAR